MFPLSLPATEKANKDIGPKGIFHCICEGCDARRTYKAPAQDIVTLCLAAGIDESRAGGLSKQFESYNISTKILQSIYSGPAGAVAIQTLLQQVEVGLEDAVMIMAALGGGNKIENDGEPSRVLALQGSSSYLMMFLKLDGMLVAMPKFKNTLVDEIKKLKSGLGDHDFTNAANVIFAHTVLQSTMTNADYVYSQRTFEFKLDNTFVVASQVWSGYLAARSQKDWSSGGAIGVDIGTGKMAFGNVTVTFTRLLLHLRSAPSLVFARTSRSLSRGRPSADLARCPSLVLVTSRPGYAERGTPTDDGLPEVKSIDLTKFESSPDGFFKQLERETRQPV